MNSAMDLRRLRTFVTVAEEGSVSKAALRLHISQPGVSRQLQELQQELGLRLFERMGRRLAMTAEGEQLVGSSRALLGQANSLSEEAQLLKRGNSGLLKVAASSIQIENTLATFVPLYARRYPDVTVRLAESAGIETFAMLESGKIHLAIGVLDTAQAEDRQLSIYPVRPLELMAACHPSFPLEGGRSIDIGRIAKHPLLLSDSTFLARKTFDAVCRIAGVKPIVMIESRSQHTKLALAEAKLGVAIISTSVQTHRYDLRTVRLTYQRKPILEPLAVMWDKRRTLPRYAHDFCELLASHMRALAPKAQPSRGDTGKMTRTFRRRAQPKSAPPRA
jgi:DNA-binding transcriptional LysR family regulator